MDNSKDRVDFFSHAINKCDLRPGDHIYVYNSWLGYSHHGIYIGRNRVIHFSGPPRGGKSKSTAMVRECSLDEFLNGNQLRLVAYGVSYAARLLKISGTCHQTECHSAEKAIETAEDHAMHPHKWNDYDLIQNNCEHFAFFCKTGIKRSAQIADFPLGFMPTT